MTGLVRKTIAKIAKQRGERMTTAAATAAGQTAEKDKEREKEKIEKRRALGRGLASLLPGPRVVVPEPGRVAGPVPGSDATVKQQMPPLQSVPSRVAADLRSGGQPGAPTPQHAKIETARNTEVVAIQAEVDAASGAPQPGIVPSMRAEVEEVETTADVAGGRAPAEVRPAWPDQRSGPAQTAEGITIYAQAETRMPGNLVVNLAIADIDKNPFQTRYVEDDEKLEELANSIRASGVVQPILVRPSEEHEGRYILILGERRLHASKKAGKDSIPALVRKVSAQQAAEMTIIENLQREDLSPLEQAEAFRVLSNEFQLTQQQIAERVGLSRESVTNYMRLLKLPREVMQMLAEKRINFAKARELLKLGDNDRIAEAALYAVKKGMNIEQVEMLVLRMDGLLDPLPDMPGQVQKKSSGARWVDPNVRAAQMDLERLLGVRVRIRDRKGKGRIVIEYSTVNDYERVVDMLRGKK